MWANTVFHVWYIITYNVYYVQCMPTDILSEYQVNMVTTCVLFTMVTCIYSRNEYHVLTNVITGWCDKNSLQFVNGSNFAKHAWTFNHEMDFDNSTLLDKGNNHTRKTQHTWHITKTVEADKNSCILWRQYNILLKNINFSAFSILRNIFILYFLIYENYSDYIIQFLMLHFITIFIHQGQFTNWELVTLCLSCVYNCSDQSFLHIFLRSSNIWSFICSLIGILHHLQVYCELTKWQAPSWLDSSVC